VTTCAGSRRKSYGSKTSSSSIKAEIGSHRPVLRQLRRKRKGRPSSRLFAEMRVGSWLRRWLVAVAAVAGVVVLLAAVYVVRVAVAARVDVAAAGGVKHGFAIDESVLIARDARGVPHIRAHSIHDLFFGEGYAMGSDRLFQMDVTRRYVDGRLAEMLGSPTIAVDRRMRRYGIRDLARQCYDGADREQRMLLAAFADGVNAAATREPQPPEYAALFFGFERWQPEDALAVGFATVLDLDDRPDDVFVRDRVRALLGRAGMDALYPATDPRYDAPTDGSAPGRIPALPALPPPATGAQASTAAAVAPGDDRATIGSNGWVVGAHHTTVGKAVLANDPHLDLGIPTIWYLLEAKAPGMHVAGAALAGTPGVTLGHNEHLAWGVTAGETAAMIVLRERTRGSDELYEGGRWITARKRHERIGVRFGAAVELDLLETPRGVVIGRHDGFAYVMDWPMRHHPHSPLTPFLRLQRAATAAEGVATMRDLTEPALNVLFADDTGMAAYHFAGAVPLDPSWGRWALDGSAPEPAFSTYASGAHVDPSRDAFAVTSNNRPSDKGPRLAPYWPPPYRAYEIRRVLRATLDAHRKLSPDEIAAEQRDASSPAEREFAGDVLAAAMRKHVDTDPALGPVLGAVRSFDGMLLPGSRGATAVVALRRDMLGALSDEHLPADLAPYYPGSGPGFEIVLRALRERPHGWVPNDDYDAFVVASLRRVQTALGHEIEPFGTYGAQPLLHDLAPFGFSMWNGPTMPGRGGSFAPAVQWNSHGQSFRALWIAGDWDHSTIDIDAGESGEPGSPHYTDQTAGWITFARTPLPFSDTAVHAAMHSALTLAP
jgi:penicillin amidase